jgi:flagellar hook-associated protein 3 FlgL
MRVTHNSIAANVLANLQGNINRLGETQQRLSSGKQISRPSDSPAATVSVLELRSEVAASKQYARNADDGLGWLNTADGALQSTSELITRARGLVLQGMSTGSMGTEARQALADEIREIGSALRGVANTSYVDRPVFGGTTNESEAYTVDPNVPGVITFNGTGESVVRTVGANVKVAVNIDGEQVFGRDATSIFATLDRIVTELQGTGAGLGAELTNLDAFAVATRTALSTVGARTNQLERMRQAADDAVLNVSKMLSEVEDIDLPKTITELQLQQTAYQAALAAGARVVQPSLIDFLR